MFFFIGGVTPKTRRIDDQPVRCPDCGLAQAYRMRVDHWLHLFFIPVFPVKRGDAFLFCERCDKAVGGRGCGAPPAGDASPPRCPSCGNAVESDFRFCPQCGQRLRSNG